MLGGKQVSLTPFVLGKGLERWLDFVSPQG
jgi:hypothetical protein